ncbi:phosphate ABC superfamily ATP binding cassette transporter, ABC protein [Neisseria shayeganii 871]|uniref:Phosphate ABC superfamily ATP binding cassette transporter, ABC protein n=1 Tax=Neisseria shayeganii 871 TaxID=1032488 RepID=G4CEX0_9NEIS|nr:phosphate ABC superfamily ATP binding cassette transporter, ABC protein [Neisseria shayeganii 871]
MIGIDKRQIKVQCRVLCACRCQTAGKAPRFSVCRAKGGRLFSTPTPHPLAVYERNA